MKTKVTRDVYHAIKVMTDNNASNDEIRRFFDVSKTLTGLIRGSKDYNEFIAKYQEAIDNNHQKRAERKKTEIVLDKSSTKTMDAKDFYLVNKLIKAVEEQNEILKQISNKLVYIVEQLS